MRVEISGDIEWTRRKGELESSVVLGAIMSMNYILSIRKELGEGNAEV